MKHPKCGYTFTWFYLRTVYWKQKACKNFSFTCLPPLLKARVLLFLSHHRYRFSLHFGHFWAYRPFSPFFWEKNQTLKLSMHLLMFTFLSHVLNTNFQNKQHKMLWKKLLLFRFKFLIKMRTKHTTHAYKIECSKRKNKSKPGITFPLKKCKLFSMHQYSFVVNITSLLNIKSEPTVKV